MHSNLFGDAIASRPLPHAKPLIDERRSSVPERSTQPGTETKVQPEVDRDGPFLLTERDAAKALAVSPRTLWGLRDAGEIPCIRIGRAVRYDPADLYAWVCQQKSLRACDS